MAEEAFDVVVIGGGPGGYVAAIRAAQLGLKTACIESRGALGGTCLNVGCIPSKALLQSSELFSELKHNAASHGVKLGKLDFDVPQMIKRKNEIVSGLTKGIEGLFKKNKVTYLRGHGRFLGKDRIEVSGKDKTVVTAKNTIIATGSEVIEIPVAKFDGKHIVGSTEALDFDKVPEHLIVIGGGFIGLEMGSVWLRLGAKVSVIEALPAVVPAMEGSVSKGLMTILKKQGMEFHLNTKVTGTQVKGGKVTVTCDHKGKSVEFVGDRVLVAVGRRANTDNLGLDAAGLKTNDRGKVDVDDHFRTGVPGIFAIGDVIRGPMLAHKAEDEGMACAEIIAGKPGHVNYEAIPGVVYTWPEVAAVGKTSEQCKAEGIEVNTGQFPFAANGRARCLGETQGFIKVIADKKTDRILGIHMIGPNASELIAEAAVAFEFAASAEDLARSVHAHPTLAECMKEACLAVDKRPIHM